MSATDTASPLRRRLNVLAERLWGTPRDWINPRRKRFWAVVALLLYTLAGFFLVPWIAQRQVVQIVGDLLDRPVRLDDVNVNPLVLSVEARGFAITEQDGSAIASFDRLYVNFQLSSLFRWAWTFREITLERPAVAFVRFADGATNLGRLIPPAEPAPEEAGLVRLVVQELTVLEGGGRFTDHVPQTTFSLPFGPINVAVHNISTLPDATGEQQVAIHTERGANLAWRGTLQVEPLRSAGHFTANGPFIPLAYRYFQDQLAVEVPNGNATLAFDYEVALKAAGGLKASIGALELALRDLQVTQQGHDVLLLPEIRLTGGHLSYPEQTAGAERLAVTAPELFAWLDADGTTSVQHMVAAGQGPEPPPPATSRAPSPGTAAPEAAGTPAAADTEPPLADWTLTLDRFDLADLSLLFEDRTLRQPGQIRVTDLDIGLGEVSNAPGARFPLTASLALAPGGDIGLRGEVGVLPTPVLAADLVVDALQLAALQPYAADLAAVRIDGGALNANVVLDASAEETFGATGQVTLSSLSIVNPEQQERLLGWEALNVDRFTYSTSGESLTVSEVLLSAPYVRLLIAEDQSTNFEHLLANAEADTDAPPPAEAAPATDGGSANGEPTGGAPLAVTVARVRVESGSADYTDLALPLPFQTSISALEGELTTLDTRSSEPAEIRLEGQVADYGLARIQGTMMPLGPTEKTDVQLLFRNVELPDLTPYTIRFAGREIDDGRMEVDLRYRMNDGHLVGQNSVVVSDLVLGEKIEYPGALDLPLGLAIALLKGPNGKINLDVPVEGDMDDPQFRLSGVIMKAMANVITSIVTSPFRLLGSLVGADTEDFGQLEFEPGHAALTPPEREKLHKLAQALTMRPQLALRVGGVFDSDADRAALQTQAVESRIEQTLASQAVEADGETPLTARRQQVIESLFAARFPDTDLTELQALFQRPADPADPEGEQVLDRTAYVAELRRRLIDSESIGRAELQTLAEERVTNVVAVLTEDPAVAADRVQTDAATEVQMTDAGWIRMELEVKPTVDS